MPRQRLIRPSFGNPLRNQGARGVALLSAFLVWFLWISPAPAPVPQAVAIWRPQAPEQTQEQVAEWNAFWAQVQAATESDTPMRALAESSLGPGQPAEGLAALGIRPAGDTIFMRHRAGFPPLPLEPHRIFQASSLSNDPIRRRELLAPLAHAELPALRYRALLELAQTALRDGTPGPEVLELLRTAEQQDLPDGEWRTDVHYLRGAIFIRQGDYDRAITELERAVELDRYSLDAWVLLLRARLHAPPNSAQTCLDHYRRVLSAAQMIGVLAERRVQYSDLAREATEWEAGDTLGLRFVAGFASFLAGDAVTATAHLQAISRRNNTLPQGCWQPIHAQSEWMLTQLKPNPSQTPP